MYHPLPGSPRPRTADPLAAHLSHAAADAHPPLPCLLSPSPSPSPSPLVYLPPATRPTRAACSPTLHPPRARMHPLPAPGMHGQGEMASPVATCTLDLGLETVCDPVQHHEICQVDDGNPHSDSEPPAAPNALHAE